MWRLKRIQEWVQGCTANTSLLIEKDESLSSLHSQALSDFVLLTKEWLSLEKCPSLCGWSGRWVIALPSSPLLPATPEVTGGLALLCLQDPLQNLESFLCVSCSFFALSPVDYFLCSLSSQRYLSSGALWAVLQFLQPPQQP